MKNKKKELPANEFRRNKVDRHPAYIYAKIGGKYKYLGITHADITKGVKNIKLDKNPNPADKKQAYVRPKSEIKKSSTFEGKLQDWKMSKSDMKKIKPLKKWVM